MRNKTWLTAIAIFFLHFSHAQDLGVIHKGINIAFQADGSFYQSSGTQPSSLQLGGHAGFFLKIPFDNRVYFIPQADLNYRRFQQKQKKPGEFYQIDEAQVRIAPMLCVDLKQIKNKTLFFQFGPSIGFGLIGRQTKINTAGGEEKTSLRYGYQAYGRYDASAHAIIGVETGNGFRFSAEYIHGLGNMINTELGPLLKYRTFAVEIGYLLLRKKG